MKANKEFIIERLLSRHSAKWKSPKQELPDCDKLVLAAYYTGEESRFNTNKGYKIYLALYHMGDMYPEFNNNDDSKLTTCKWYIISNDFSNVNYSTVITKDKLPNKTKQNKEYINSIIECQKLSKIILEHSITKKKHINISKEDLGKANVDSYIYNIESHEKDITPDFWMYIPEIF